MDYLTARGWLTPNERNFLHQSAKALPQNALILNIGVEYGASVVCLAEANPTAKIVALDIDISKYAGPKYPNLELIQADSAYYTRNWKWPLIDFAFIDGDHGYDGVLVDCEYTYLVSGPGAILSFHDCYSWDYPGQKIVNSIVPGVNEAVSYYMRRGRRSSQWLELPFVDSIRVFQNQNISKK